MKAILSRLARAVPVFKRVLDDRIQLERELLELKRQIGYPPGHFYSPIPSPECIAAAISAPEDVSFNQPPGIDLNDNTQLTWLNKVATHFHNMPFPRHQTEGWRYWLENDVFTFSDAYFLLAIMREIRPTRIIEVGSGFSSAAMLDVNERFFNGSIRFLFIEPFANRLRSLLNNRDTEFELLEEPLQVVVGKPWRELAENDILFIDSSHVSKSGSDVNKIFFEILPELSRGVLVHIHDIFNGFEYPRAWLETGRFWNEAYLTRAFLQFNQAFEILAWPSYLAVKHRQEVERLVPACLENTGGSLWLRRRH